MSQAAPDLFFGALADPNRRSIIELLASGGPATATSLSSRLGMTRQGAAKHLSGLAEAGIVTGARQGREVRYELREQGLEPGRVWFEQVGDKWDRRLTALQRHLDD